MSRDRHPRRRRSLSSSLMLLVALPLVAYLSFSIWATIADYRTARDETQQATERQARGAAERIDASIEAALGVVRSEASQINSDTFATGCTVTTTGVGAFPSAAFSVLDRNGSVICGSGGASGGVGYGDAAWFQHMSSAAADELVEGPVTDPRTGRPSVVVAVAARRGTTVMMALDTSRIAVASDAELMISTSAGHAIAGETRAGGLIASTASMRSLPWDVEASIAETVAFDGPWSRVKHRAAFASILALLLAVAGRLVTRRITDAIGSLTGAVERAVGQVEPTPLPEDGPEEIAALGRRLNRLIRQRAEDEVGLVDVFDGQERRTTGRREIDRMKSAFLMAISHELRTPLAVVTGYADMLQDEIGSLSEEQTVEMAHDIARGARRLEGLLIDILDVEKMSRGVFEAQRRPTHLRELVGRVVEFSDTHGAVNVSVPNDLVADVDPGLTERIIDNLVRNAVKHTSPGTPIWVDASCHDGELEITVADAGPGVPDSLKVDIFDAFSQGPTPSHSPGTGIGLSLVAQFARMHQGRAWVDDRPGGGARFHVTFADARPQAQMVA